MRDEDRIHNVLHMSDSKGRLVRGITINRNWDEDIRVEVDWNDGSKDIVRGATIDQVLYRFGQRDGIGK